MTGRAETLAFRAVLALASAIVCADWFLPSSVTLFFDELFLFALIWVARKTALLRRF